MRSEMSVGRTVGILLLLQMASALILPFVLMRALNGGYPDFLEAAAASGNQIRAGMALAFFGAALTLLLGIKMFPVLKQYSRGAALWFLGICAISSRSTPCTTEPCFQCSRSANGLRTLAAPTQPYTKPGERRLRQCEGRHTSFNYSPSARG